jgi:hypothetical protein
LFWHFLLGLLLLNGFYVDLKKKIPFHGNIKTIRVNEREDVLKIRSETRSEREENILRA